MPLIRAGSKVTYNTLDPIIHESKVYIKEGSENITNNYDNLNINGNNATDANFDYNNLIANNGESTQNGVI